MANEVDVLVVGGGPTGLLLTSELAIRGVSCLLIDANPAPLHWDRATVVHPRSLEFFDAIGIVAPFLELGAKQRLAKIHSEGNRLATIDLSLCGSRYPFNIGISEEVTERVLTEHLERAGGSVTRASRLVEIDDRGDRVVATIERSGVTERIETAWVVGCDGLRSGTRTGAGIEMVGSDIEKPWAVFDATIPEWPDTYEGNFGYLDEPTVLMTALPGRTWRVYLHPRSPESDLVNDAKGTVEKYVPGVRFESVRNPMRFHCHTKIASSYRAGRILLAGDAAHVCSPAQGHGMNTGLGDAFNLGWKLALVCKGLADESLLDSYESERRAVARHVMKQGEDFENALLLKDVAARCERDQAIARAFADDQSRHHEAAAEAELDISYAGSPIVLEEKRAEGGGIEAGERIVDSIAIARSSVRWLHELTHRRGHTALILGGPESNAAEVATLRDEIAKRGTPIIEESVAMTVHASAPSGVARMTPGAAAGLGVSGTTLLVVRPDLHIGLRADRDHVRALEQYCGAVLGVRRGHAG